MFRALVNQRVFATGLPSVALYYQYSGIVTLIKKYDFFSEILLSKSDESW